VTATLESPPDVGDPEPEPAGRRRPGRGVLIAAVLIAWVLLGIALQGRWTLAIGGAELTDLHRRLNDVRDTIGENRDSNPFFVYFVNEIRVFVDGLTGFVQGLIAQESYGRPVPVIGWLGVTALITLVAGAVGTVRTALLAAVGFVVLGLQGLWEESMDTFALTISAVLLCLLIGVPLGIWAGTSPRVHRVVEPVLDFLQTMPSFVFLAPLTLFFLIGPASAVIITLLYAVPPVVRYTAHGIRTVPRTAVEASASLGATGAQRLRTVLLPMSRRTMLLGVNQTIMAALSMVTIAALINAPGLGDTVLKALSSVDVGNAFNGGLAIVILAIVLDRITTAAGRRSEAARARSARAARLRRPALGIGLLLTVLAVHLSRTYLWAAQFPATLTLGGRERDIDVGNDIAKAAQSVSDWMQTHLSGLTTDLKNGVTSALLNPLQDLLTQSPWFVTGLALVALAGLLGGLRTAAVAAVALVLLIRTGLWQDSMTTLAMVLVATAVVMILGVVVGVWMARRPRVDAVVRPVLDAAQVMPAFVYLVPFIALFDPSRFTAIVAAVVYGAPVAIKVIADGVRAVPVSAVEASTVAGSTAWQQITKVQLPMARQSLILATNQGLCYVLSMVVVGGLVGAQALGYLVVAGFSQYELYGKGLAAGVAIVLLGVMLNQVTRAAAERQRLS
jgi:glycine betaine/proline transport system permease protein